MKSNGTTLIILTPAFPKDESDTNWIPSHQLLVKTLKAISAELNIVVLTFLYPDYSATYTWNGVRVTSFNGNVFRKWRRLYLWRNIWRELGRIRREGHVIGILSFWCGETALIGEYFGKLYGIRHRCWISGQDAQKSNKWVKFIRPRPEELVAMSTFLLHTFFKNHGVKPLHVIPNGIDQQLFSPEIPREKDIDILGVGSLEPLKQYHLLVEVVESLRRKIPAVRAIHCGDGSQRKDLQSMIEKKGLGQHLCLAGEKPHREVLQLMQRTKILLHTSSYEGFSTVCLEALYAGAHVISFCDPMDQRTPQWHIVSDVQEMTERALAILSAPETEYRSVLLHSMEEIAHSVKKLYYETDPA
jgi:glycosyltransferase involved in cell wall biosynthesis